MAQKIQFIYLTQSEYDGLTKQNSRIYFTSDTHRIYKGSDLYAATEFDLISVSEIEVSDITVNGSSVALEGHSHSSSDISDFASSVVSVGTSVFASSTHTHDELSGLTSSTISKDSAWFDAISASTGTFQNLVVTGDVSISLSQAEFGSIIASEILVNGSSVSLEGHGHSTADISGLDSMLSGYASISHSHVMADVSGLSPLLSGITESSVTKNLVSANTGTFGSISAESATFSSITVQVADFTTTTVSAQAMTVGGSNVSVEGHGHSVADISGLDAVLSDYASASHSHVIADVSGLSDILSGITSSTIYKDSGTFDQVTADVGNFRLISVSGSANFAVNNVSASSVKVNGTNVALEGHTHSASDLNGVVLNNALSGQTFDFSDMRGVYLAMSSMIALCGGSIANFPSFNQ